MADYDGIILGAGHNSLILQAYLGMAGLKVVCFEQRHLAGGGLTVEDQLMRDTWQVAGYDLLPKLRSLRIPTLVIAGDGDFIPVAVAEHIARAILGAKLVTIKDCGHFAYLECAGGVRDAFDDFFRPARRRRGGR